MSRAHPFFVSFEVLKIIFLKLPNILASNFLQITEIVVCPFDIQIVPFRSLIPGGGVLPYMGYIGTCRGIGYGF